jgi:S-methylmethionine-dependent homocysteine/selenocysteine methylase
VIETLRARLAAGEVVLIDGATGTELQARGVPMHQAAWCGVANLEHEQVVRAVHEDYIRAGAEVIIANTFPCSRLALQAAGLGERVVEINTRAVRAARQARENAAEGPVLIAGSMSPHGADDLSPPADVQFVRRSFAEQATALAQAGVDLIALEMIRSSVYGELALQAAIDTGLPVWLGVSGWSSASDAKPTQSLGELVNALRDPAIMAVNVMHTTIEQTPGALAEVRSAWDGVLGAYAHHGDWTPPNWVFKDIVPERYLSAASGWVASGAALIGGCCGIGPRHIELLARKLPRRVGA